MAMNNPTYKGIPLVFNPPRCPLCNTEMTRCAPDDKFDCPLCRANAEINRLRAWIMRTASDDNLKHRAGYHGRRVMMEAAAVLNGHTIPKPKTSVDDED